MTMERQKSDDEGKKEQNKGRAEKISCSQIGVSNLECIGTHCWSVWAGSCS
jgi:hypothetical protein